MKDTGIIVETFTELAPRYEQTMDSELQELWGISYCDFVSNIVEMIQVREADVVLDVATGTARIPLTFLRQLAVPRCVVGLDITPAMLQGGLADIQSLKLTEKLHLVCGSAMAMPFADGLYDLITCGLGMHHLEVTRTLREMGRLLKTGGNLVLVAVCAPRLWRIFPVSVLLRFAVFAVFWLTNNRARAWAESAAVGNIHTAGEWQQILSDLGFSRIDMRSEYIGRRFWYPNSLMIKASKGV
jgi:demethylmenaquinone methyltransferase/2-methoxy-6-polyprenyl-1,4-benzoquinol methylase